MSARTTTLTLLAIASVMFGSLPLLAAGECTVALQANCTRSSHFGINNLTCASASAFVTCCGGGGSLYSSNTYYTKARIMKSLLCDCPSYATCTSQEPGTARMIGEYQLFDTNTISGNCTQLDRVDNCFDSTSCEDSLASGYMQSLSASITVRCLTYCDATCQAALTTAAAALGGALLAMIIIPVVIVIIVIAIIIYCCCCKKKNQVVVVQQGVVP